MGVPHGRAWPVRLHQAGGPTQGVSIIPARPDGLGNRSCRALRDALEEAAASRRTPAARRLAIASQTWPQPRIAAFDIQVFLCTAHIILYRWQGFSKAMRSAMLKEPFPQLRAAQLREGGWVWHQPQQQARRRRAAEEVAEEEERAPPSDVEMDQAA